MQIHPHAFLVASIGQVVKTSPFHGENAGSTPAWMIHRRPFADVFTQSAMDTLVSLAENGHFAIVLSFEPQWCVRTRNDKQTAGSKHRLTM